jgi:hypothetical protein
MREEFERDDTRSALSRPRLNATAPRHAPASAYPASGCAQTVRLAFRAVRLNQRPDLRWLKNDYRWRLPLHWRTTIEIRRPRDRDVDVHLVCQRVPGHSANWIVGRDDKDDVVGPRQKPERST